MNTTTTRKKKSLTVTARKGNHVVEQVATTPDQKQRWIALFEKNGFRVITGKKI